MHCVRLNLAFICLFGKYCLRAALARHLFTYHCHSLSTARPLGSFANAYKCTLGIMNQFVVLSCMWASDIINHNIVMSAMWFIAFSTCSRRLSWITGCDPNYSSCRNINYEREALETMQILSRADLRIASPLWWSSSRFAQQKGGRFIHMPIWIEWNMSVTSVRRRQRSRLRIAHC